MTRLVVIQHLEREGPGLLGLEAAGRPGCSAGWPGGLETIRAEAHRWGAQVARQGQRLIANLVDVLTADLPSS